MRWTWCATSAATMCCASSEQSRRSTTRGVRSRQSPSATFIFHTGPKRRCTTRTQSFGTRFSFPKRRSTYAQGRGRGRPRTRQQNFSSCPCGSWQQPWRSSIHACPLFHLFNQSRRWLATCAKTGGVRTIAAVLIQFSPCRPARLSRHCVATRGIFGVLRVQWQRSHTKLARWREMAMAHNDNPPYARMRPPRATRQTADRRQVQVLEWSITFEHRARRTQWLCQPVKIPAGRQTNVQQENLSSMFLPPRVLERGPRASGGASGLKVDRTYRL